MGILECFTLVVLLALLGIYTTLYTVGFIFPELEVNHYLTSICPICLGARTRKKLTH